MSDTAYIVSRTLEHKIAMAENNGNNALIVTLDVLKEILSLLKEQEAVEPITKHHLFLCPVCKKVLLREQKYCHECGKQINWEGR